MKAKEKILLEAVKLFSEKGFTETSADEIILKSGISKGLLFYHFKNKEGLLNAVIEQSWEIIQQSCNIEVSDNNPGRTVKQLIRQMIGSLKRDYHYWKVYALVLQNKNLSEKLNIEIADPSDAYMNIIVDLFEQKDKRNPERWAFSFDLHFKGIYFGYIANPKSFPLDDGRQVMFDLFAR
jgi:TetR/AcrR family transcriptional regulator, repressor of the mexAB-oprM multidrug resistance operon